MNTSARVVGLGWVRTVVPDRLRGGRTWAVIASLVETCKVNGVNPQGYLCDVITRIVGGHPQSQFDELMHWPYLTVPGLRAAA